MTGTYTAVCRRSGNWWAISIRELKGVHTQARRLDQVADMARDAIALMLEIDPGEVHVTVEPEMPAPVEEALAARRAAREAEQTAERATAAAVRQLLGDGYTIRDAGRLLGLSPQRISQIAPRASRTSRGRPPHRSAVTAGQARELTSPVHSSSAFGEAIVASMLERGWRLGSNADYRPELGLDTAQLFEFIGATQAEQWAQLLTFYGNDADAAQEGFTRRLGQCPASACRTRAG